MRSAASSIFRSHRPATISTAGIVPGKNLFGNSLVALDARTGKRLWHFQFVHHDLWDYDLPAAPKLFTVRHNGKLVDAVAQPTKMGFLFVFNRVTGEPLWPIEERPVPKSDVPGEHAWPTQPIPTLPPPFARQKFTADDMNPYIPARGARGTARQNPQLPERRSVYAAEFARHNRDAGTQWRSQLGWRRGGSFGGAALRAIQGIAHVYKTGLAHAARGSDGGRGRRDSRTAGRRRLFAELRRMSRSRSLRAGRCVPSLIGITSRLTADQIKTTVANGQGRMPAFSQLTPRNLNALVAYLTNPYGSQSRHDRTARTATGCGGKRALQWTTTLLGSGRFYVHQQSPVGYRTALVATHGL